MLASDLTDVRVAMAAFQEKLREKFFGPDYWIEMTKRQRAPHFDLLKSLRSFGASMKALSQRFSRKPAPVGAAPAADAEAPAEAPAPAATKWRLRGEKPRDREDLDFRRAIRSFCKKAYPDAPPEFYCPDFKEDFGFVHDRLKQVARERKAIADAALQPLGNDMSWMVRLKGPGCRSWWAVALACNQCIRA